MRVYLESPRNRIKFKNVQLSLCVGVRISQLSAEATLILRKGQEALGDWQNTWLQVELHVVDDGLSDNKVLAHGSD